MLDPNATQSQGATDEGKGAPQPTPTQSSATGEAAAGAAQPSDDAAVGDEPKGDKDKAWLNERIARAKTSAERAVEERHKAWLKSKFGTDDPKAAEQRLDALAKLEKEAEDRKRAQMSEVDRLKADLARERTMREKSELRVKEAEQLRMFDQQTSAIKSIAARSIADEYVDDVSILFARYLKQNVSQDEADKMTDKDITKWFTDFAKRKPAFALPVNIPPAPAPKKVPVNNGPPVAGQKQPQPNSSAQTKTPRPGQPNSMSKAEYNAYLKSRGMQY